MPRKDPAKSIRIGDYWQGRLDEWLGELKSGTVESTSDDGLQNWSFPTNELREEYIASIDRRSESEVKMLLEYFLFDPTTFGADHRNLEHLLSDKSFHEEAIRTSEYHRRLLRVIGGAPAHPGVRWILDTLPDSPRRAITVIEAYLGAHFWVMPDGRIDGMFDAAAVIRAAFIEHSPSSSISALNEISPREFEVLTANLYARLGYEVELTAPSADGGRDVVAHQRSPGRAQVLLIECKHYRGGTVGVRYGRTLLGVVSDERKSGGVIVTSGTVSRGIRDLASRNDRLSYIDGNQLVRLLNAEFGHGWPSRIDDLVSRVRDN
jgi:restriction system protein